MPTAITRTFRTALPFWTAMLRAISATPSGGCSLHYFDQRGVTRLYHFSTEVGVLRFWRGWPGFSQRFMGTLSTDGNTVAAVAELCQDGITREENLRVTYKKAT